MITINSGAAFAVSGFGCVIPGAARAAIRNQIQRMPLLPARHLKKGISLLPIGAVNRAHSQKQPHLQSKRKISGALDEYSLELDILRHSSPDELVGSSRWSARDSWVWKAG
jgi:hypothetical protein